MIYTVSDKLRNWMDIEKKTIRDVAYLCHISTVTIVNILHKRPSRIYKPTAIGLIKGTRGYITFEDCGIAKKSKKVNTL